MGWLGASAHPIGIDFGGHSVRLMQLRGGRTSLALQAAARVDRGAWPEPVTAEAIAETVKRGLGAGDFRGRSCAMALSSMTLCSRSLRLPQMPDNELPQALQWEVKDRFGFDAEPGSVVYFKAGEVRRGTEIRDELLVFAGNPAVVNPYLQAFMQLGLTVQAIDLQPCAILRSLERIEALGGCGAVVDIGARGSQLMIHAGGVLAFYKHIEIGAAALDEAVSQKLGVSPEEAAQMRDRLAKAPVADPHADAAGIAGGEEDMPAALLQAVQDAMRPKVEELAREIDMCLRYYVVTFRAARPESLLAVGRQASHGQLLEMLGGSLSLAVTAGQVLRGVKGLTDATRPDRSAEWAVAAGLSLYPVGRASEAAA
jgi:type IV pilus assembly protein PilM